MKRYIRILAASLVLTLNLTRCGQKEEDWQKLYEEIHRRQQEVSCCRIFTTKKGPRESFSCLRPMPADCVESILIIELAL